MIMFSGGLQRYPANLIGMKTKTSDIVIGIWLLLNPLCKILNIKELLILLSPSKLSRHILALPCMNLAIESLFKRYPKLVIRPTNSSSANGSSSLFIAD